MNVSFTNKSDFFRPTLVLDKNRLRRNIEKMISLAGTYPEKLRPHFKTHMSAQVAEIIRSYGVKRCTTSSVYMAEYFAHHGWDDITVAVPVNTNECKQINDLAAEIKLSILIDNNESINVLAKKLTHTVNVFIKVDMGYRRAGIPAEKTEVIAQLARKIEKQSRMNFAGILTHAGHTYKASSTNEIFNIYEQSRNMLLNVKKNILATGLNSCLVSYGDTPSCSIVKDFNNIDELRPGNMIIYDLMQSCLGSCGLDEIAVAIACPVTSVYPERNQALLYGGAVHLSKENIKYKGQMVSGLALKANEKGWNVDDIVGLVVSVSQEHGIVELDKNMQGKISPGDWLFVLPAHSCLAINLYSKFNTLDGETFIILPRQ